jgi:hypothetical protein
MATPLTVVAGIFGTIFGLSKAIAITEGLSAAIAGRKVGFAAAEVSYKSFANVLSIKGNALAAIELAADGSKLTFKQLGLALEGESLAVKTAAYGIALKDLAVENAKKGVLIVQNLIEKAGLVIQQSALLLTIREAWKSIAGAAMSAFESAAKIPFVGWALGGIAAAGAIALGASLMTKGDDVVSKGGSSGGYGNRTLLLPKGAISLNNEDTIIAGTDLDKKEKVKPSIQPVPILNNETIKPSIETSVLKSNTAQRPQIDMNMLVTSLNNVNQTNAQGFKQLEQATIASANKPAVINGKSAFVKDTFNEANKTAYKFA